MTVFTFPAIQIDTTGLATEAKQQAQTALLTTIDADTGSISTSAASIDGKTPNLGQALMAGSVPVTIASNQSAVPVSGPLTDTQLRATAVPVSGPLTDTQLRATAVPVSGPLTDTQLRATAVPVSGPLTDTQLRASAVPVSAASLPLPAGAATESTLSALNAKVTAVNTGAVVVSGALPAGANTIGAVTQSGTWTVQPGNTANTTAWLVTAAGKTAVNKVRNDYTSTAVTTGAYVELLSAAAFTTACTEIEIFDSSGSTLVLATGAAASESDKIYIIPGGNGRVQLAIAASTRISIKAVSGNASVGEIIINFYG